MASTPNCGKARKKKHSALKCRIAPKFGLLGQSEITLAQLPPKTREYFPVSNAWSPISPGFSRLRGKKKRHLLKQN